MGEGGGGWWRRGEGGGEAGGRGRGGWTGGAGARGGVRWLGKGGLERHRPRGWTRPQVLTISRGRPRGGAGAPCKAIGWNRPPWEDRSAT